MIMSRDTNSDYISFTSLKWLHVEALLFEIFGSNKERRERLQCLCHVITDGDDVHCDGCQRLESTGPVGVIMEEICSCNSPSQEQKDKSGCAQC